MKATATRADGFRHTLKIRHHELTSGETSEHGGGDEGPSPQELLAASLASCTAVTMEIYAERKGWEIGAVEVDVDATYDGHVPTAFEVTVRLPAGLDEEQRERLLAVASKCPVHRALSGETTVSISDRVEVL